MKKVFFLVGVFLIWVVQIGATSENVYASRRSTRGSKSSSARLQGKKQERKISNGSTTPRIIYPKNTEFDFEGMAIDGEVKNPGELYFSTRPDENFDSLVKRRKNFHSELMRETNGLR